MITTTTCYTGELQIGDFVCVSEGYVMYLGFYAGRGIGNSFQYLMLHQLANWWDDPHKDKWIPRKSYHNTYNDRRAIKYSPEYLTED